MFIARKINWIVVRGPLGETFPTKSRQAFPHHSETSVYHWAWATFQMSHHHSFTQVAISCNMQVMQVPIWSSCCLYNSTVCKPVVCPHCLWVLCMENFGWEAQKNLNYVQFVYFCGLFCELFLLTLASWTNVAEQGDTLFCHHGRVVGPWLFMVGRVYLVYLKELHLNLVDLTLGVTHVWMMTNYPWYHLISESFICVLLVWGRRI